FAYYVHECIPLHSAPSPAIQTLHWLWRCQQSQQRQSRSAGRHLRLDPDLLQRSKVRLPAVDYAVLLRDPLSVVHPRRCTQERAPQHGLRESALRAALVSLTLLSTERRILRRSFSFRESIKTFFSPKILPSLYETSCLVVPC